MCNVSSFFLSGKPVFDIKPCSLQAPSLNISNTTFSDISRKTGSGCIFEKVIESDELFSVNDVIIEDCTTEDGNGGGFWIESNYGSSLRIGVSEKETSFSRCSCKNLLPGNGYGGGMYLKFDKGASDFIVTSTSFTECSASKGGSNIFIECWCLKELINATSLNFSREDMLNRDLMGFEEGNENAPIELEAFFVEFNGTGYVCGDNGCDFSGCGTYSYPCASLSHLISLRFELIDRNIIINSIVTLEEAIEMNDFECEMTGVTTTTQFDVYPSSSISSGNVISIRNNANLINLCFSLHPSFSSASAFIKFVPSIEEDKLLRIFSCSFSGISGSEISYAIISSTNGKITISECTLSELLSSSSLMLFESTVEINQSHFRDTCAPSSVKGGALSVYLKKGQCFSLNESSSNNCECSNTSGKGGFVYLNAFLSILEEPFLFKTCSFEGNSAFLGKNIFLEVNNLSKSVSMNTLNINFDGMNYDENLLIGNDIIFTKPIDLLHFFIPRVYSNVYLSTVSFDLIGCGSVDVPCKSFGKAINQRDMNLSEWTIYVGDTAIINDHFNLSNCFLKPKLQENNKDSVRFYLQSHASTGEVPSMSNEGSLSFLDIAFRIEAVGTNTLKTIVINSGDLLSFAHCSFENVGNEADQNDYSIVIMKKGKLQIDDISIQNNKNKKDAFVISFGCESAFNNLEIISSFIDEGGAIRIGADQESFHNEQIIITHILINGSTFRSIERSNKGASVIQSEKEGEQVDLNINDTSFESCSAPSSTRGGAVMFSLHEGRSLRITDSTFTQCNCSYSNGRGGALFISAKSHKELDFLLNRVSFAYNLAHVGWNVFVECYNISSQINETQFKLDFRTIPSQLHLFSGCDTTDHTDDTDLMQFITIYQDSTIVVSNAPNKSSTNSRLCGSYEQPCISLGYALEHLVHTFESRLMIDQQTFIESEIDLKNLSMHALSTEQSNVSFSSDLSKTRDSLLNTFSRVIIESISFKFSPQTHLMHNVIFYAVNGSLKILSSTFESTDLTSIAFASQLFRISAASLIMEKVRYQLLSLHSIVNFQVESSSLSISDIILSSLILSDNAINFFKISETTFVTNVRVFNTSLLGGSIIYFHSSGNAHLEVSKHTRTSFSLLNFANISSAGPSGCAVFIEKLTDAPLDIINCSFNNCSSSSEKGNTISIHSSKDILFSSCSISGSNDLPETDEKNHETNEKFGEICKWSGSLVDAVNSSVALKDTTIENSSTGGMTISGGNILVEKGEFINNSPSVEKYPSVRRNIICADSGELNVISYKNGDGLMNDTSFWILNEGCQLKGIISDVSSVLFIPSLRHVKAVEEDDVLKLNCTGSLLLPCGLSLLFITKVEDLHIKENYTFGDEDYVSETEVHANIPSSAISSAPAEAEVFISIQFGGLSSSSTTAQWILKNKTEVQTNLTDNIVKGEKSSSSLWIIIVIVMSVILFIILIIAVAFIVRWKKAKRRTEELEVIVEDTVRKDPKLIEMMTMEMSPEEQWRRTKREEAKKNEERIKKRVYEKTIQHSESSEYLLSESGSTEYILGRDSDKIPEWVLEKVDEKEEDVISRKRTPSPSISSTSTTDTSDTESTFVRSESLCPTTSSMSNLVDAMACSSPHEKLIVDLRDSLFMLLHGRNEKKEMAIDTLQEREQTAAQILFWVANLALHSFDEMDNPLSSLANLSPHIVLFSEHMVIAIAMHSDCSSDSDSSSISSASTIVSSSSDQKSSNRNGKSSPPPSSAFEDDEDNRKECMRWKAPELMINRNATASKKTVSFSIGMMLWECLTLQIPFGEYEAEVAGQKIVNGERPSLEAIDSSTYFESVRSCLSENYDDRQSLIRLKREFIQHFPAGAVIMTVSDAVDFAISGRDKKSDYASTEAEDLSCSSFF
ncbi:uncharacterized protein MONOS_2443 [Monocercomonoides exilis]|uniref:uncharacterized protein n=1 Tax=Monocercomonoides exilis TaxID=2049356 RepID=UPI0035595FD2|nr:hypothetical protein MONOS_2443 [Monocercomonoides exilis]|eukprot:MONOS_2443.1-p1 / transcript=MONOS_2443.1 / gene=MONOS_2443 / organism=Monocercomonoides_exilis_PA203 / gene_product=unspecified product / transcript_product=unspecified product / location=Mono_scaffold00050:134018-139693(-) / protein_length=1891 / sequence_SO=supercontig / SO=protein_coding / is_pseudo=false